jgi:hypothetical protein
MEGTMFKITSQSHVDHGLSEAHIAHLHAVTGDRSGFFIETFELPEGLSDLRCTLHGPAMGDEPVSEIEVEYRTRGDRPYPSRMHGWPSRPTRLVTVIVGPDGTLWTAFGGPITPQEPDELAAKFIEACGKVSDEEFEALRLKLVASREFWAHHALGDL